MKTLVLALLVPAVIYLLIRTANMATVQEVKDAIAAEKAEVQVKLDALLARIAELEAGAGGATPEELAELKAGIEGIFTPS